MGCMAMKVALVIGIAVALVGAVNAGRVVPAVYVLGDSTLDVGNNNYLSGKDVPRADKPFYGVDFPGGRPTGRFSNGYNAADFVAKNLGFDRSPVAYLALKSRNCLFPDALTKGVSYASAGAGILDSTNAGNNIPLSKQVRYFASTKAKMQAVVGSRKVAWILANSFFLLDIGSNDLYVNQPQTPADVAAIYTTLVSNYSAVITDLYKMGARKFGIINLGPLGCVPVVRVLNPTGACIDAINHYAAGFNAALKSALAALAPKLPGLAYSIGDSFAATQASLANPQSLGFVSADSACCGVGRLGAEGPCTRNATLCAKRDTYVFWDAGHPTQRTAELGIRGMFNGPLQLAAPISFKQLAQKRYY